MYGAPDDVPGECNARLHLGDNFGDGTCTCRCTLEPDHDGPHQELSRHGLMSEDSLAPHHIVIQWQGDARIEDTWDRYRSAKFHAAGVPEDWDGWDEQMPSDWDWKAHLHLLDD